MKGKFVLDAKFSPAGGQKNAISSLVDNLTTSKNQVLLGVTGSGKTYTVANVIEQYQRPTLIISQNKTLAAQLYSEFKQFFPSNHVELFISYYDFYLPESYKPQTDTYIAKDFAVNEEIEKYRLSSTSSLMNFSDVIIVASVSCIYGLGSPDELASLMIVFNKKDEFNLESVLLRLVEMHYKRNDFAPERSCFAVRGDVLDVYLSYDDHFVRIEFFGDEIERITLRHLVSHKILEELEEIVVFPASHFATRSDKLSGVISKIEKEMKLQVEFFEKENKLVEAQRIFQRTMYDIEMLSELKYCTGIENYSRYLSGRKKGEKPYTLLDYFPDDFLLIVDESHVTLPQFRAMYNADKSRKTMLVEHGFRLPSALDNRPLTFDEFTQSIHKQIFVSATPQEYEVAESSHVVPLVIRPTGLLDPLVEIRPLESQIDDIMEEVRIRQEKNEGVIIACLTQANAEALADYFNEANFKADYIHSKLDVIERIEVLRRLRNKEITAIIGINLLREGMDLPEVSLVAIMDADKEGFLRSRSALIQIAGRAARNANGRVILYANRTTASMQQLLTYSAANRKQQEEYNKKHNIVPKTIKRQEQLSLSITSKKKVKEKVVEVSEEEIARLQEEMLQAAEKLQFELAAELRDRIIKLKKDLKKR